MTESFKADCLMCGQPLLYINEYCNFVCELCGKIFESQVFCKEGHFVWDICHQSAGNDLIEKVCIQSSSIKPVELAITLMKSSSIKMHGPEHHFLVSAVLLTAYYNTRKKAPEKEKKIHIARKRAENILGGFCGYHGAAAPALGQGFLLQYFPTLIRLQKNNGGFRT